MSTEVFVRVLRDGAPVKFEIEQLSDKERDEWLALFADREKLVRLIHMLCHELQESRQ